MGLKQATASPDHRPIPHASTAPGGGGSTMVRMNYDKADHRRVTLPPSSAKEASAIQTTIENLFHLKNELRPGDSQQTKASLNTTIEKLKGKLKSENGGSPNSHQVRLNTFDSI